MLGVELPVDLEKRLTNLMETTGQSQKFVIIQALTEYLEEYEDSLIAISRLEKNGKRISFNELEKELDMDR